MFPLSEGGEEMEGTCEEDLAGCQNIQPSSDIIGGLCHLHFSIDVFLCLLEYDLYHIYVEDITAERFLHLSLIHI